MGQKVHPIGMRVGIIRDWDAKWYAEKEYADYLHEDLAIRKFVQKELADAAVSTIEIERAVNKVNVSLHTAKPGMVIGKGGANVDALRAKLNKMTGKQVHINIIRIYKFNCTVYFFYFCFLNVIVLCWGNKCRSIYTFSF